MMEVKLPVSCLRVISRAGSVSSSWMSDNAFWQVPFLTNDVKGTLKLGWPAGT
jgi:hypothetical protein